MLSKSIFFFFGILILLFLIISCFSGAAIAQVNKPELVLLPELLDTEKFDPNAFVVYGKEADQKDVHIAENVLYKPIPPPPDPPLDPPLRDLPNLEEFFEFGGTLELVATTSSTTSSLNKYDIVISEIMWGFDEGSLKSDIQWIELYITRHVDTDEDLSLFFLFTPFENHPNRDEVTPLDVDVNIEFPDERPVYVLDAVSNLHLGRWNLPGRGGRLPYSSIISTYRNIDYNVVENENLSREARLAGIPFGSYENSWKETPEGGSRNTVFNIANGRGRIIATPGAKHVPDSFLDPFLTTEVFSDRVVINEVRNDISRHNLDWIELKNVGYEEVDLENWELSIVTREDGENMDTDLVDLPRYILFPEEILLIQRLHPSETPLADGIDITEPVIRPRGAIHQYFVYEDLDLPKDKKFTLLLRSESNKSGEDTAIEDYAGNGFFTYTDTFDTDFWPRVGQRRPTNVANFGERDGTFGSLNSSWARLRYQEDDGHHRDAWKKDEEQSGIGYDPGADMSVSPGTPGYENTALKTRVDDNNFRTPSIGNEYDEGELSISEIMSDAGPQGNKAQWIEFYNSSLTQAVSLKGWTLEIYNLADDVNSYASGGFNFNEAVILPNQTLLLVSRNAVHNLIGNRVYDLYQQHRSELKISNRRTLLLNPDGFYLRLIDERYEQHNIRSIVIDEVGNLNAGNRRRTRWDLPLRGPERRRSLVRQYGLRFRPDEQGLYSEPEPAEPGTLEEAWRQADLDSINTGITYYGDLSDVGTPGYRLGGPLPVQLSSFRPELTTAGEISISWATESELNNAGFNILRSERREGVFVIINPSLILGAGTSSEKHTYRFTDTTAKPDVAYYYRIEDVSFAGERRTLVTTRLKGYLSASDKRAKTWGELKR